MRLDKFLCHAMVGTNKTVKQLIYDEQITVNNHICTQPWQQINEQDTVYYAGVLLHLKPKAYYIFNKPCGCITSKDSGDKPSVFDYFKEEKNPALFAVGRLDKETSGLLIVTNDGHLSQLISNPTTHTPKTYFFIARGHLTQNYINELQNGVPLFSETLTLPAKFSGVQTGFYPQFAKTVVDYKCVINSQSQSTEPITIGYLTITQGQKHQVRKMLKYANCSIIALQRVAIGGLKLPAKLPEGEFIKTDLQKLLKKINNTS